MKTFNKASLAVLLSVALLSGSAWVLALAQSLPPLTSGTGVVGADPMLDAGNNPPVNPESPGYLPVDGVWPDDEAVSVEELDRQVIPGTPPPVFSDGTVKILPPKKGKVTVSVPAEQKQASSAKAEEQPAAKTPAKTPAKPSKPVAAKKWTPASGKAKPLVQFPANTLPRADETSNPVPHPVQPGPVEPGPAGRAITGAQDPKQNTKGPYYLYPRGYKAYVAPMNADQKKLHNTAILHYNRGNWFTRRDRVDEAIAEYRQALVLNPAFADARVGLAAAHMKKNDWETVIDESRQALRQKDAFQDPASIVQGWYNLTAAYCVVDDYRMAKVYYKLLKKNGHPATGALDLYIQKTCKP